MAEIRRKSRLIHNIQEFKKIYLPKEINEVEMHSGDTGREFGADLTKKIMSKIDLKK